MRSTTTSLPKVARYSAASFPMRTTASGSSALTWKIGTDWRLAISEAKREECSSVGLVVKPIRLFTIDRKSTRLNSSHSQISYAVFCLKKKHTTRAFQPKPVRGAVAKIRLAGAAAVPWDPAEPPPPLKPSPLVGPGTTQDNPRVAPLLP